MTLLRPIREDDFADAFDISADYQVVQGVGSWPWPAQPAYTRMRLNTDEVKTGQVLAIDVDGHYAGSIGLVDGEMGYMLARRYWGQGIASRAVAEMLALGFGQSGLQAVRAAAWSDNIASQRVLQKNGFEWVGQGEDYGRGRDRISPIERFLLTRTRYESLKR